MNKTAAGLVLLLGLSACGVRQADGGAGHEAAAPDTVAAAAFDADSAMAMLRAQVEMGARTPGSDAHLECRRWIAATLQRYGADTVIISPASVTTADGREVTAWNILGRFGTGRSAPVLLAAHYDTRPMADQEEDPARRERPVPGANDGASGVAVLLETARQLQRQAAPVAVDMLFTDVEDSGISGGDDTSATWCLGTQAWTEGGMPYSAQDPWPRYAVLLDMVGGRDARFHREFYSLQNAPGIVAKVWGLAARIGEGSRFVEENGGGVVDDHIWLARAGIPAIDIIENQNPATGSFAPHWHTLADDLTAVDAATLGSVGRVVNTLIRQEQP